jgi:hypothetical protein
VIGLLLAKRWPVDGRCVRLARSGPLAVTFPAHPKHLGLRPIAPAPMPPTLGPAMDLIGGYYTNLILIDFCTGPIHF